MKSRKTKKALIKVVLTVRKEKLEALAQLLENEKLKETERLLMNTFDIMKKGLDIDKEEVKEGYKLPYKCNKCQFEATSSDLLKKHRLEQHSKGNGVKCATCDFTCSTDAILKDHILKNHSELYVSC